jgi:hypothetical protein
MMMTLAGATAVAGCSNGSSGRRTGTQEESAEAHPPEVEAAAEDEVVAAAEAEPPAVPVRAQARIAGAASWSGQVHGGEVFSHALARLVEPCFDGGALPRDVTVSVPVATDGSLGEASLAPMGAGDEARLTCIRAALTVARVDASGDPLGGHLTVPLRVEAATAERAPFTFPAHPDDLCVRDADCVLITGDCTSPAAARDLRASERARQNRAAALGGRVRGWSHDGAGARGVHGPAVRHCPERPPRVAALPADVRVRERAASLWRLGRGGTPGRARGPHRVRGRDPGLQHRERPRRHPPSVLPLRVLRLRVAEPMSEAETSPPREGEASRIRGVVRTAGQTLRSS